MNFIYKLLGTPLGWIMYGIYKIIPNYGLALLIFTALTRVVMFPMSINQQKNTAKMRTMQPEIDEVRKKFAKDSARMNEEMNKVYEREGYNPSSGCLPMLIQFPILFGLIDVIYNPLKHILRLSDNVISTATKIFSLLAEPLANQSTLQIEIINSVRTKPTFFALLGTSAIAQMANFDFTFLGMNLMLRPSVDMITGMFSGGFDPVVIIPILSGISAFLSSWLSQKNMPSQSGQGGADGMMKGMMLTMPLMSVWIAFTVPAGVGLYWVYANVFAIIQSLYMNKFHNPNKIYEELLVESEARRQTKKEEAQRDLIEKNMIDDTGKAMSQKEINRIRLAEARKRDAAKYGIEDQDIQQEDEDDEDDEYL